MPNHIYGYFEDDDDFRPTTKKRWGNQFKISGAKKYLENHLLKSLENDFKVAHRSFKRKNAGFFALPRIIFPYITFLGALYGGEDKSSNAMEFMVEYLGRVDKVYKSLAGLIYIGYRHGLMHTNMPKLFVSNRRWYGWHITHAPATVRNRDDFLTRSGSLIMYPHLFYKDLCKAIKFYISDFDDTNRQALLFENFKKSFIEMAKTQSVKETPKDSRRFLKKSLRYLKY